MYHLTSETVETLIPLIKTLVPPYFQTDVLVIDYLGIAESQINTLLPQSPAFILNPPISYKEIPDIYLGNVAEPQNTTVIFVDGKQAVDTRIFQRAVLVDVGGLRVKCGCYFYVVEREPYEQPH